jgi:signal transduction histidine kinase
LPHNVDLDFLHALLHDLIGPVSRIRMLGELIERRATGLDPEIQVLLGHIKTSTDSAENVLEALRRYTDALHWSCRLTRFDLDIAVKSALARLDRDIAGSGARVIQSAMPNVQADMVQMGALFEELIANAVRFRSEDPPVIEILAELTTQELTGQGTTCFISVIDNGMGLSDSAAERIFRPLAKASERSGAGMGLAICRHIAELHGGEISAIPRLRGAEFRLRLPQ